MANLSVLETIRDRCVEKAGGMDENGENRTGGLADFDGVMVLSRKRGDLLSTVATAIGRLGVCMVVSVPEAVPKGNQSTRVIFSPVRVIFEISENVLLNQDEGGTGKGAMFLAERVAASFQMFRPLDDPENKGASLMFSAPGIMELPAPRDLPSQGGIDFSKLYILAVHFEITCAVPPATT